MTDFTAINKSLKHKLYLSMNWKFYSDPDRKNGEGYWLSPDEVKVKIKRATAKNAEKIKVACCVCGQLIDKKKMKPRKYKTHRLKNGRIVIVINKKYECKRCTKRNESHAKH